MRAAITALSLSTTLMLGAAVAQDPPQAAAPAATPAAAVAPASFNERTLEIARSYPTDGTHGYWWPKGDEAQYDGCSADIFLDGQRVMKGEEGKRTYCCGWTLEVFAKAYQEWAAKKPAAARPLAAKDFDEFKRLWFVESLNGPGPSAALVKYKMGREIPAEQARPGDFVQIWRTPNDKGKTTGHSVIFVDWVRDEAGKTIGIRYLSTQTSTNGIAENVENYGPDGGINAEKTYFARVELPA